MVLLPMPLQPDGLLEQLECGVAIDLDEAGPALQTHALPMASKVHLGAPTASKSITIATVATPDHRQTAKDQPLVVQKRSSCLDQFLVVLRLALASKLLAAQLKHEAERLR